MHAWPDFSLKPFFMVFGNFEINLLFIMEVKIPGLSFAILKSISVNVLF